MSNYEAFKNGDKILTDLTTEAVYEIPFSLRYSISPAKTIDEAEEWLNDEDSYTADNQCDTMAFGLMETIMDEDFEYSDETKETFGNGLVKKIIYKFDDDQSGKLYIEATRQLTEEEQSVVQDHLTELHYQGMGAMSECFNVFLDHDEIIDVWNTWDDADIQTTFELNEIPLEEYLFRMQSDENSDDFTKAVDALSSNEIQQEQ